MRQISYHRPNQKVRGVSRRIRAFKQWVKATENFFPPGEEQREYWNEKMPVLDRLVNPPTTTRSIQSQCANLLLQAGSDRVAASHCKPDSSMVTVLLTLPNLHSSEICIYFNKAYLKKVFQRNTPFEKITPLNKTVEDSGLDILLPAEFASVGFCYHYYDESGHFEEQWWLLYDKRYRHWVEDLT